MYALIDIPSSIYLISANSKTIASHTLNFQQNFTSTDCFKYSFFPQDNTSSEQTTVDRSRGFLLGILQEGAVGPDLQIVIFMSLHPDDECWAVSAGQVTQYLQGSRTGHTHMGEKWRRSTFCYFFRSLFLTSYYSWTSLANFFHPYCPVSLFLAHHLRICKSM